MAMAVKASSLTATVDVTVLVAARNEALNIALCVQSLQCAERVVVLDSHSVDDTADIARANGAEVVQFEFEPGQVKKRQWAMDKLSFTTSWLLLLDADERVPEALWDEISAVTSKKDADAAYLITKGFHFLGHRFRFGGFSHAAVLLMRPGAGRFERLIAAECGEPDMEIHERVFVHGSTGRLSHPLVHADEKGLQAYIDRHEDYAKWEARLRCQFLETGRWGEEGIEPALFGDSQQRRRWLKQLSARTPFEPCLWFLYHYVLRLGILEGKAGFMASYLRASHFANVRRKTRLLRRQ